MEGQAEEQVDTEDEAAVGERVLQALLLVLAAFSEEAHGERDHGEHARCKQSHETTEETEEEDLPQGVGFLHHGLGTSDHGRIEIDVGEFQFRRSGARLKPGEFRIVRIERNTAQLESTGLQEVNEIDRLRWQALRIVACAEIKIPGDASGRIVHLEPLCENGELLELLHVHGEHLVHAFHHLGS